MNNVFILGLVSMDLWCPGHLANVYTSLEDETRLQLADDSLRNFSISAQSLRAPITYNLKQSLFQTLENYHVDGIPANDNKYPWIASVVHSRTQDFPFLCTATCVSTGVFITSARCISTIKIAYTTVKYKKIRFRVKLFVLPSKPSKQWFDDIGIIVVEPNLAFKAAWSSIQLINVKRVPNKNNEFKWFEDLKYEKQPVQHIVVGYGTEKRLGTTPESVYRLVELPVVVGIDMCEKTLSRQLKNQYHVPCYSYCNLNLPEFTKDISKCKKYIGSDGAVVFNTKSGKLLGVATWTINSNEMLAPVGIAVANSEQFKKDLLCAKKLQADSTKNPPKGYFQKLCPS